MYQAIFEHSQHGGHFERRARLYGGTHRVVVGFPPALSATSQVGDSADSPGFDFHQHGGAPLRIVVVHSPEQGIFHDILQVDIYRGHHVVATSGVYG